MKIHMLQIPKNERLQETYLSVIVSSKKIHITTRLNFIIVIYSNMDDANPNARKPVHHKTFPYIRRGMGIIFSSTKMYVSSTNQRMIN